MSNERNDEALGQLAATTELLRVISYQLDRLIVQTAPLGPDYRRPLAAFKGFDFSSIGADVIASDGQGVSAVEWNGHQFTRRSAGGKYGDAIWFSRAVGKQDGETQYVRLVAFKGNGKIEAEKIPFKI